MAGYSTISDFVSFIKKNNIARTNRYRIIFTIPEMLREEFIISENSASLTAQNELSLTCMIANIPGVQMQTSQIQYGNIAPRKATYGRSTSDITTSFILTGKYQEKKLFDAWTSIVCRDAEGSIEFYDSYIGSILIECLNEQDQVQYKFRLSEAYPISVSDLRLDRTSMNQAMLLDVTWAYHIIYFMDDESKTTNPTKTSQNNAIIPNAKKRLLPIPGLEGFSSAVQGAVETVKEFRGQLQGVLDIAKDVREQVRDAKMTVLDGVKTLNGVVKDVKAIINIPNEVKNEVISVVVDTRNQLGSLKSDVKNLAKFPKR